MSEAVHTESVEDSAEEVSQEQSIQEDEPVIPVQPTAILNDYHAEKTSDENGSASERTMLINRIRFHCSKNKGINPFKCSPMQEKFAEMSIQQLRDALDSVEEQVNISTPYGVSQAILTAFNVLIQKAIGYELSDDLKKDPQCLSIIDKQIPTFISAHGDLLQFGEKVYNGLTKIQKKGPEEHGFPLSTPPTASPSPSHLPNQVPTEADAFIEPWQNK